MPCHRRRISSCGRPRCASPSSGNCWPCRAPRTTGSRSCWPIAYLPYPGGSVVIPPNGFPQWDINIAAPRVLKLGAVMPKHIDLALCRQKLMIPKVDMFANRLVETYAPIVAA